MEKRTRVVVYGSSINMAGIAASLRADSNLEVLCDSPDSPTARQSLQENSLAAIVFDLSDSSPGLNVKLLRDRPGLLLIGVDPGKNDIRIFSSRSDQVLSITDLVDVIQQKKSTNKPLERNEK
jgi:hypothetical protein